MTALQRGQQQDVMVAAAALQQRQLQQPRCSTRTGTCDHGRRASCSTLQPLAAAGTHANKPHLPGQEAAHKAALLHQAQCILRVGRIPGRRRRQQAGQHQQARLRGRAGRRQHRWGTGRGMRASDCAAGEGSSIHEAAAAATTRLGSVRSSSPNSTCRAAARGTQPRRYSPLPHLERLAVGCRHLGCAAQEGLLNGIWSGGGRVQGNRLWVHTGQQNQLGGR